MALPHKLLSDTTSLPFEYCSVCECELKGKLYFLEKAYHRNLSKSGHSTIFEYAMCHDCKKDMLQQISQESMQKMKAFMLSHQEDIGGMMNIEPELNKCSFSDKSLDEVEEYHIVAVIKDDELQMNPMIFGDEIMMEYQELLSQETKGFFNDFYDEFIGVPPALAKIIGKNVKPVII